MSEANSNNNQQAFIALVKAGLWNKEVRLLQYKAIDFKEVLRIAEQQSVVGLLAAGIEHVQDFRVPQTDVLTIAGRALQIEQQNIAMNQFVAVLLEKMQSEHINALLVKGQGIAQCYEKPLWRACGDVDLLLNEINYKRAKSYLVPLASKVEIEDVERMHFAMTIDKWEVELHGTLHSKLGKIIDKVVDTIQQDTIDNKRVRVWRNSGVDVILPAPDNDIIFVFVHILQHFFRGGIGLRQVCDWCRLLWTYRGEIDSGVLEDRLRQMRVLSEWQAFAALAVEHLGMPEEAMPLYSPKKKWKSKAKRILAIVLETGNFGHNRDTSYYDKYPLLIYKAISLKRHTSDSFKQFMIFPRESIISWRSMMSIGIEEVIKRKSA